MSDDHSKIVPFPDPPQYLAACCNDPQRRLASRIFNRFADEMPPAAAARCTEVLMLKLQGRAER